VVWLYFRFSLSFRDIEELMASRALPTAILKKLKKVESFNSH